MTPQAVPSNTRNALKICKNPGAEVMLWWDFLETSSGLPLNTRFLENPNGGICLNVKVLVKQPEAEHIFVIYLLWKVAGFFCRLDMLIGKVCWIFWCSQRFNGPCDAERVGNNGSGRLTHFGAHCWVSKMHRRVFAGKKHHFDIRTVFSSVQMWGSL